MKKAIKTVLLLLCTAAVLVGATVTSFADGTVTYEGNARKFIFAPGSDYSPTDLFTDFKDVMPGDSITQKVFIKNEASNNVKIKLYMRALGAHEDSEDFLSQLKLTVTQSGDSVLFDAPADQTAQLTEWTYLGTFYSGAQIDLNVTLNVPIELDNQYQKSVGYLDWQFKVEELPIEDSDPGNPDTNAWTGWIPYLAVAVGSACVLIGLLIVFRRRNRADND